MNGFMNDWSRRNNRNHDWQLNINSKDRLTEKRLKFHTVKCWILLMSHDLNYILSFLFKRMEELLTLLNNFNKNDYMNDDFIGKWSKFIYPQNSSCCPTISDKCIQNIHLYQNLLLCLIFWHLVGVKCFSTIGMVKNNFEWWGNF